MRFDFRVCVNTYPLRKWLTNEKTVRVFAVVWEPDVIINHYRGL